MEKSGEIRGRSVKVSHSPIERWARVMAIQTGMPEGFSLLPNAPFYKYSYGRQCLSDHVILNSYGSSSTLKRLGCQGLDFALCTPFSMKGIRYSRSEIASDVLQHLKTSHAAATPPDSDGDKTVWQSTLEGQSAKRIVEELAADFRPWGIRLFGFILSHTFRWLFGSKIYVESEGLAKLKQLSASHTIVYIPTHKSHTDYLMMSYILFASGLQCPHIAAGKQNNC